MKRTEKVWYKVRAQVEGEPDTAEFLISDFIGDWIDDMWKWDSDGPVTAKSFIKDLQALPESVRTIRVRINSPGGDVFAAVQIANALRDQRASKGRIVETVVEGLAASAASVVLMAGDPVRVADNGLVMVHNPWTGTIGDAKEMRAAADMLDKIKGTIVSTYQWHSEMSDEDLSALMDAETWLDADAAIAAGLADEKIAGLRAAASITPEALAKLHVPDEYRARVAAWLAPKVDPEEPEDPEDEPEPDAALAPAAAVMICREHGLDLEFAAALMAPGRIVSTEPEDEARRLAQAERDRRAADKARREGITALCAKHSLAALAPDLCESGMTLDAAKRHVAAVIAVLDSVETNASLLPDGARPTGQVIDVQAIYAARRPRAS